jgi:hypothetical protein
LNPQEKARQIKIIERDMAELTRQRSLAENNPGWSQHMRQQAMAKIDADLAAKKAELSRLNTR